MVPNSDRACAEAAGPGRPPVTVPARPFEVLLLAVWFGLVVGLANVAMRGVALAVSEDYERTRFWTRAWMSPLVDVGFLGTVGVVTAIAALRWPRLVTLRVASAVFAFPGCLGLIFLAGFLTASRMHPYAAMMLGAGLAVQIARLIAVHGEGFRRLVKATAIPTLVAVAVLSVAVRGWRWIAEQHTLARLPAASAGAPNVLLITLDTVRAQSLSLYGYERETTPRLEQLAKAGVVFERALATASWTLPSHASIFTGEYPHKVLIRKETVLGTAHPTLAEILSKHGYHTAGFVANLHHCAAHSGLNRGFAHYEDYPRKSEIVLASTVGQIIDNSSKLQTWLQLNYKSDLNRAPGINRDFLRWLSRRPGRPFFAFLNYMDAHDPYVPPAAFEEKFRSSAVRTVVEAERDAYEACLAHLDDQVGHLLDELARRQILFQTLVIITSDHGEHFGEHGLTRHGGSLYRQEVQVPLVILFPGSVPANKRVSTPVSLRDLPATVMDILKLSGDNIFPGRSLARHWNAGPSDPGSEVLFSEVRTGQYLPAVRQREMGAGISSLVTESVHYVKSEGTAGEELYDFEKDTAETNNLVGTARGDRLVVRLRAVIGQVAKHDEAEHTERLETVAEFKP